jgi:glycosyltransferase involved in cell wall biosynthesis
VVSVVLATNRRSRFLAEAIASVAEQTMPDWEMIIVDDGSPDPAAISALVSHHPRVRIIRQHPAGVAAARNRGVEEATGELIAFLDDDDRWHPDRLAAHVDAHIRNDRAVASYCRLRTIDESGTQVLAEGDQSMVTSQSDIAARRTGILAPNLVVRRDVFREVDGYSTALRFAEDLDLVLKLAARGPIAFAERGLVDYRAHADNTTGRYRELADSIDKVLRQHRQSAVDAKDEGLVAAFDESIRKNDRFVWWSALRAARSALAERRPLSASGDIAWALSTAPAGLWHGLRKRFTRRRDGIG